jgi:hypothetical protein
MEFVGDEQAAAYGRFTGQSSRGELEQFLFLDNADQALTDKRCGDHDRLGFPADPAEHDTIQRRAGDGPGRKPCEWPVLTGE